MGQSHNGNSLEQAGNGTGFTFLPNLGKAANSCTLQTIAFSGFSGCLISIHKNILDFVEGRRVFRLRLGRGAGVHPKVISAG
jgi:hypothetical protein